MPADGRNPAPCVGCGAAEWSPVTAVQPFGGPVHTYVRCRVCSTAQLVNWPESEEIEALYQGSYRPCCSDFALERSDLLTRLHRLNFTGLGRRIESRAAVGDGPRTLLDVGCGGGVFLATMRDRGWRVSGLEPNVELAARVRRGLGLDVRSGRLEDAPDDLGGFDVVTLLDVLEHMPDPESGLRHARRLLKPGGLLVVLTPNMRSLEYRVFGENWYGFQAPDHLWLFSPDGLRSLVSRAGYGQVEIERSIVSYAWSSLRVKLRLTTIPGVLDAGLKAALAIPFGLAGLATRAPAQVELYAPNERPPVD